MNADKPTCDTCPYWEPTDRTGNGWCQRFPPWPPEPSRYELIPRRVITFGDDWCGEHPNAPSYVAAFASPSAPGPRPPDPGDNDECDQDDDVP